MQVSIFHPWKALQGLGHVLFPNSSRCVIQGANLLGAMAYCARKIALQRDKRLVGHFLQPFTPVKTSGPGSGQSYS